MNTKEIVNFLSSPKKDTVKIGVFGDYALDVFQDGEVDRISPEAPVPVLKANQRTQKLGCAGNVVANLSSISEILNAELSCLGVLGIDYGGDQIQSMIKNTSFVVNSCFIQESTRETPVKTRFTARGHHQLLRVDQESTGSISPNIEEKVLNKIPEFLDGLSALIIQDHFKGTTTPKILNALIQQCRRSDIFCVIDPNVNANFHHYAGASLLTPNALETSKIVFPHAFDVTSQESVEESLNLICKNLNLENILITRGAHGLSLKCKSGEIHHYKAYAQEVFDVTGAGDTVVAALTLCHAAGANLELATQIANVAAAIVVAKKGTATATPSEILAFLKAK